MPPKSPRPSGSAKKPAARRSRPPKRPGRGASRPGWRIYLTLLASAVALIGLVWLARREAPPPPAPPQQPVATAVDSSAAAREQVESFLAAAGIPAAAIERTPADLPRVYQVRQRLPAAAGIERLRRELRELAPPLQLKTPEDAVLTVVDGQGRTLLTLHFLPAPPPAAVAPAPGRPGKVAIIMDDLGRGTHQAKQLLALRQPVTFAILPGEPRAAEVARMAHAAGREVMMHVPMEPHGFPVVDPGDDALFVSQSPDDLRERIAAMLAQVPHAAGVNNHMGSRFTEDARAMAAVMTALHGRGLFFVDSLTTSHSVGGDAARRAGVPVLRRDVFLDNVAEVDLIVREIRRLADKARRNGFAVGICHPYPETFQALRRELPKLAEQGIEFVSVAALLGGRDEGSVTKDP